jgi:hypothetical protein
MIVQTTAPTISPRASWESGLAVISDAPSGLKKNNAKNKHAYTTIRPMKLIFLSHAFLRRFSTSRLSISTTDASSSASPAALGFHNARKLFRGRASMAGLIGLTAY